MQLLESRETASETLSYLKAPFEGARFAAFADDLGWDAPPKSPAAHNDGAGASGGSSAGVPGPTFQSAAGMSSTAAGTGSVTAAAAPPVAMSSSALTPAITTADAGGGFSP